MRNQFDEQLDELNTAMIEMGALCEDAIANTMKAIDDGSDALSEKVIRISAEIDQKEKEIETRCLKLLLQQQPVARDLRQISAALKMITDMERIGDQAEEIAALVRFLGGHGAGNDALICEMARRAVNMVTESVDAYVKYDIMLAERVIAEDDEVDARFIQVKAELIDAIAKNPSNGELDLDLLMIAKYFERIADHAVNIAEWVIFAVTGVHKGDKGL